MGHRNTDSALMISESIRRAFGTAMMFPAQDQVIMTFPRSAPGRHKSFPWSAAADSKLAATAFRLAHSPIAGGAHARPRFRVAVDDQPPAHTCSDVSSAVLAGARPTAQLYSRFGYLAGKNVDIPGSGAGFLPMVRAPQRPSPADLRTVRQNPRSGRV